MTQPDDFFSEFPLEWEMSAAERFTMIGLLARLRPQVAIEIGTHHGGSLQVLHAFCGRVHAIDIDPEVSVRLAPRFPKVRFHIGLSRERIPEALAEIEAAEGKLGFVLVDGDHRAPEVRADIEALLRHRPRTTVYVLLHDSFNPDCRRGMRAAAWSESPHVRSVELDFVPGIFNAVAGAHVFARSMWGGFALAILTPEYRAGPLVVRAAQEPMNRFVYPHSAHRIWHKAMRFMRRRFFR